MGRPRELLRSGAWLTRERIRLIAAAVLIASAAGFLYLVVTANGLVDRQGRPLGTDFSDVYAAGTYVLDGDPEAPFDPARQHAREQQIFGEATPFYGWHYPPFFLFAAAALALMPYGIALAAWQAVTLGLYLLTIRAIVRSPLQDNLAFQRADWILLALAFPAVLINVGHGQNGFLTAALLGAALLQLDRRPILAGILFGLLAYKPQFGLLIPVVLAATGRWRSFATAAVTVALLALATTFAFGPHVWQAFSDSTRFTRVVALEQGDTGWYKIQSLFAWARMWGASVTVAYALQAALIVALGAALIWLWRSTAPYPLKAAALCLAAILATPYTFDYDMMVLAPAIAFVAVDGLARGFGPWEKTALAALWLVPLVARSVAHVTLIPLGVPIMLAIFILLLRRSTIQLAFPMASSGAFILK
ncbi:MAG: glycosyltransferase family 87 protein [Xanthobacteraceae bacterium]